jgi:hypothetical protein
MHLMTSQQPRQLRIDMRDVNNRTSLAEYATFNVTGADDGYRKLTSGYSGDAGRHKTDIDEY